MRLVCVAQPDVPPLLQPQHGLRQLRSQPASGPDGPCARNQEVTAASGLQQSDNLSTPREDAPNLRAWSQSPIPRLCRCDVTCMFVPPKCDIGLTGMICPKSGLASQNSALSISFHRALVTNSSRLQLPTPPDDYLTLTTTNNWNV
jgi:hypothetical protein